VYGTVSNGTVKNEHVTMYTYIAIIDLDCRNGSESGGQRTEYFCSIRTSKNYYKLVEEPVREFFSKSQL